jgi:hypothetical protein
MKNIEIRKELEELAPTLAGLEKPQKPKIPELYFEGFANRLISNMELDKLKTLQSVKQESILSKIWWFFAQPRFAIASAASVIVIVSCLFLVPGMEKQKEMAINVSQEDARDYIIQNIDQFDTKSLADEDFSEAEVNKIMDESLPQDEVKKVIDENIENLNIDDLL